VHAVPDYSTLRAQTGFGWSVSAAYSACLALAGVPIREFFLDPDACIEAWCTGPRKVLEMFGEFVRIPGPATPPISYGHVNALGAELLFPEGGEVGHTHPFENLSLAEATRRLQDTVEFERAGMAPFYLRFKERMERAFPGKKIGFGYGLEGPITTAWELRGERFFTDLFDQPEELGRFLETVVSSIRDFHTFLCRVNGTPPINPSGGGMCDDLASTIPPRYWRSLVLPAWESFFDGRTTGKRSAHVEDLRPAQLPFLEEIHLWFYDPSISPQLTPAVIAAGCRVPFQWRLAAFHYRDHDETAVRDFVLRAVSEGASRVCTIIEASMCTPATAAKVQAFANACREVERLLQEGVPRERLAEFAECGDDPVFWTSWQTGRKRSGGQPPGNDVQSPGSGV